MRYPLNSDSLSNLTGLHLEDNALTGTIPPELGDLASLGGPLLERERTERTDSARTGSDPEPHQDRREREPIDGRDPSRDCGQLPELELLNLRNNRLTGEIPAELATREVPLGMGQVSG